MNYVDSTISRSSAPRPVRPDGVDKVTGRAQFGADMVLPGMLVGQGLRSPHAHARIKSIDTSKALSAARREGGRHRAPTSRRSRHEEASSAKAPMNFRDLSRNMHGARQGAVRGPRGGRGRRDLAGDRRRGARR